ELLESPLPEADRRRFAANIGAQSERMADMIDKLLALAAVEHRQRIESPRPVDLAAVAREVAEAVAPRLHARGVALALEADDPLPPPAGDAFLLRQALENLVDNAIGYSPSGGVVSVVLHARPDGVVLEVADDGPGVPDYALDRVFERFYSLPRPGDGGRSSGIGLTFVAEVAQLHGGRARLSNRARGALATLELPVA